MENEKVKKEKAKPINLTDALVRGLPTKEKDYFISDTTPGLRLRVWPGGEKVWYFIYRPKGKNPQKLKLDNFKNYRLEVRELDVRKLMQIYLTTLIRLSLKNNGTINQHLAKL